MAFETTLPGRYFYDPDIYARARAPLRSDVDLCRPRRRAPAAGDFKTVELAGESVLVVRGRDELRAFLNVCRHRGGAPQPGAVWQHRRRHPMHVPRLVLRAGRSPHRRSQHRP